MKKIINGSELDPIQCYLLKTKVRKYFTKNRHIILWPWPDWLFTIIRNVRNRLSTVDLWTRLMAWLGRANPWWILDSSRLVRENIAALVACSSVTLGQGACGWKWIGTFPPPSVDKDNVNYIILLNVTDYIPQYSQWKLFTASSETSNQSPGRQVTLPIKLPSQHQINHRHLSQHIAYAHHAFNQSKQSTR